MLIGGAVSDTTSTQPEKQTKVDTARQDPNATPAKGKPESKKSAPESVARDTSQPARKKSATADAPSDKAASSAAGKSEASSANATSPQQIKAEAGDTLSGPLPGMLTADKSPYLALADLYVPQGQTVIIEPGVVILFTAFTGLKVQGTLLAKGTSDEPIVFTSGNDAVHNPVSTLKAAPYDWNGIQITEDGIGSHLAYCAIRYSVYGIVSMTRYIRIGPSVFEENGRADLTIAGHEHEVGNDPYEYNLATHPGSLPDSLIVLRDPRARARAILRYSGMGVLAAGAVVGAVYTYRFSQSSDELDALSATEPQNLATYSSSDWKDARDRAQGDRVGMIIGYLIGVLGATGFGISFAF